MTFHTLSILIPCYNEEHLIKSVLSKIVSAPIENYIKKELIVVDDGSSDNTPLMIEEFIAVNPDVDIKFLRQPSNKGKGAAIRLAIPEITGEITVIQDADLEYDPYEFCKLLKPITDGHADVVYGSRFRGSEAHRILFFWHTIGNKLLTLWSNLLTGLNITDMETGYKMIRTDILKILKLKEERFGFEPEITAKLSRIKNIRIYEVGISYYGRNYNDGKKINWKDGVKALWCTFKYNVLSK